MYDMYVSRLEGRSWTVERTRLRRNETVPSSAIDDQVGFAGALEHQQAS